MARHSELVLLIEAWRAAGEPDQPPIAWSRKPWNKHFGSGPVDLEGLPSRLSRDYVRERMSGAADSEDAAIEGFIVAMIWGFGTTGYGAWRTKRIIKHNPEIGTKLRKAAQSQRDGGAIASYRYLSGAGRIRFLGPAFGTKFLHFSPTSDGQRPAIILDAVVSRSARELLGVRINSVPWHLDKYVNFLTLLEQVCRSLSEAGHNVAPADLERLLFARQRGTEDWIRRLDKSSKH